MGPPSPRPSRTCLINPLIYALDIAPSSCCWIEMPRHPNEEGPERRGEQRPGKALSPTGGSVGKKEAQTVVEDWPDIDR